MQAQGPESWGLSRKNGELWMAGHGLPALAATYGTPLYVGDTEVLRLRCRELTSAFEDYPGQVALHFSYKTNPVAGVLRILHEEGMGAEVVSGHELRIARRLGVEPRQIVFNGPYKTDDELRTAVEDGIGLLVVDGLSELRRLTVIAATASRPVRIALRLCPDLVPRGGNSSSGTGSKKNQFGMTSESAELAEALALAVADPHIEPVGIHVHIGSGIHHLKAFQRAAERVMEVYARAAAVGAPMRLIDLGGGLGTRHSRELSTFAMLRYLATGRLPKALRSASPTLFHDYGRVVSQAITGACRKLGVEIPDLVLEPGRALVSDSMLLLLQVGAVRERPGVGPMAITDGGAMSLSPMFLSEQHAVLLANRSAPEDGRTSIFGRLPSPMDIVYRFLRTPRLEPGDLLAVMDAGAYFIATSSNFGGPRPAVILLDGEEVRVARRRETTDDLARLDPDL